MATDSANSPPRFRKLRIAWSVAWSLVAVLLLALWIRSYLRWDLIDSGDRPPNGGVSSLWGDVGFYIATEPARRPPLASLQWGSAPIDKIQRQNRWLPSFKANDRLTSLSLPYWLLFVTTAFAACLPRLRW